MKKDLAIAYAMKKKASRKKMAEGGETLKPKSESLADSASKFFSSAPQPSPSQTAQSGSSSAQDSMRKAFKYAKGGELRPGSLLDEEEIINEIDSLDMSHDDFDVVPTQYNKAHVAMNGSAMKEDNKDLNQRRVNMQESNSQEEEDMVDRIMRKRFSEGGKVANDTPPIADEMPAQYDDLVLRDDLESTYGDDDNSGDSLGNAQEDSDRKDMVARIMASRRKKDRLPNPR